MMQKNLADAVCGKVTLWSGRAAIALCYAIGLVTHPVQADAFWCGSNMHTIVAPGGQIGVGGSVSAMTVWNGDLIVGGSFTTAGGQTVNRIARWDGSAWHPLASGGQIGMNNAVYALTVWNGDLIAGGSFSTAGGQTVNRIARWDGAAWHPFTFGGQIGVISTVRALTVWNGDLIAGGNFNTAGGQTVNKIARWDGSAWNPLTSGGQIGLGGPSSFQDRRVEDLAVWNGELIVGGSFSSAGGQTVNHIARWNGSAWHPLTAPGGQIGIGSSTLSTVYALTVWNGDLVAGGFFTSAGGQTANYIARWDGTAWHAFISGGSNGVAGESNPWVFTLAVWNGDLIAGGRFNTAGGQTVNRVVRWSDSSWYPFLSGGQSGIVGGQSGTDGSMSALTVWNSDLIAGGDFATAGGQTANNMSRWADTDHCGSDSVFLAGGSLLVNGTTEWTQGWYSDSDSSTAPGAVGSHVAMVYGETDTARIRSAAWLDLSITSDIQTTVQITGQAWAEAAEEWKSWECDECPQICDECNMGCKKYGSENWCGLETCDACCEWDCDCEFHCDEWWLSDISLATTTSSFVNDPLILHVQHEYTYTISGDTSDVSFTSIDGPLTDQTIGPGTYAIGINLAVSIDTGVYQSSKSLNWALTLDLDANVLGDLNDDGVVDVSDLLVLLANWGECPTGGTPAPPCPADLNNDGAVDVSDLLILLGNWG